MKKKLGYIGILLAVLLLLSWLLLMAESGAEGASIRSISDALWYMIVTLTTVGYGDLYPVTTLGKIIGIIFVLSSMGLLGFLLASIISTFNSDGVKLLYLKRHRDEEWYVFSEFNEKTGFLIRDIKSKGKGIFVCLQEKEDTSVDGVINIGCSFDKIIGLKNDKSTLHLFFMKDCDNDYENYSDYHNSCNDYLSDNVLPFHCYCLTEYVPEVIPVNLVCFNKYENVSRLYWNIYPIRCDLGYDEKIVIIGSGKYGSSILEHALKGNVFKVGQEVEYHLFGEWNNFRTEHYRLKEYFSIDKKGDAVDSIFYHESSWMENREVVENASRIIICDNDEDNNLMILSKLRTYYALRNKDLQIHVLYSRKIDDTGIYTFGAINDIYSDEFVMKEKQNRAAIGMHEIYRKENDKATDWNHLSTFRRQSNQAVADHMAIKMRILDAVTPKEAYDRYRALSDKEKLVLWHLEHDRWMRFHILYNWHYASVRDDSVREHNLLVAFDRLPYEEQKKDAYSWELLSKIENL
ncbi:ion channel [Butyrivibrio sp. MC2021]|uniref:ion channel n=1 Tax=Butyrivibrio sp. MC2021 TaxID=1408306 RepID=UPI000688E9E5|nr:ion channel [Butyrivibrio sp. MC2021]